jgi:hypothetical protein
MCLCNLHVYGPRSSCEKFEECPCFLVVLKASKNSVGQQSIVYGPKP